MDSSQPANRVAVVTNQQPNRPSAQQSSDQECSVYETKRQCYLFLVVAAGYYGVLLLAALTCLRRGNFFLSFIVFLFVFFPVGLKVCWVKFEKWQNKKAVLQQNAEQFARLSMRGTERQAEGQATTASQVNNETSAENRNSESMDGNLSAAGGLNLPGGMVDQEIADSAGMGLTVPPPYSSTRPSELPPSYDEVIRLYGQPELQGGSLGSTLQPTEQQQQDGQQHRQRQEPQQPEEGEQQ